MTGNFIVIFIRGFKEFFPLNCTKYTNTRWMLGGKQRGNKRTSRTNEGVYDVKMFGAAYGMFRTLFSVPTILHKK
jgi:hypothetical protein